MSGSSPTYNYPAQPTYGEGMADAMKAQMEQLLGQGDYADIYKKAGFEGGNLGDILTGVEGPIRKQTAQLDTDVMRQTLLGSEKKVVLDPETGKYGIPGGQAVTSEQMGSDAPTQTAGGRYQIVQLTQEVPGERIGYNQYAPNTPAQYYVLDTSTGGALASSDYSVKAISAQFRELNNSVNAAAEAGTPESEVKLEYEFTNPNTGKPLQEGDTVRAGDGMVDLVGDSRAVQEQTQSKDYAQYVKDNPDLQADFNAKRQAGENITIEEYGQQHYDKFGKAEGRELAMGEYSLQDAGRQAGFDQSGKFMGLSALSEDIARGGQQRAREADIADVERLGGRATDAYRAQGDLSGALATARNMGAGGSGGFSAIPKDPLFDGVATNSLAARATAENANIDAITSGGVGALKARGATPLTAETGYTPSASISGGRMGDYDTTSAQGFPTGGTDAFRSALMQEGMGALDQGLSERENRAVQEAARARSTNMGRTFDQTASIDESRAVIEEDNARRMQNRAFAQSALNQEVDIQQADMGRGLQASLANQQATNQAAQFGVGAGLQQEQLGAQMDQQVNLAEFAQASDAAKYSAQEAMQAKQMELGRQTAGVERQLTAEEKDIERIMRQQAMEEQYRQQGLGAERANAAQMVGLEQATSADPFQAILQRQGQNNLAAGGVVFGQAGYGLDSGPQYLNPESGLGFIQNQATNAANMYGAQVGADATKTAGMWSGLGSLAGGLGGGMIAKYCWVAREVYGAHNPAWLDFRHWMFSSAPKWFFKLYLTFGERFANFISNKPRLKARIRLWMDTKIGR
jgi:hypothetical protein